MIIDDEPFVPRRRVSVDRPSQPTYPWRTPSIDSQVDRIFNKIIEYDVINNIAQNIQNVGQDAPVTEAPEEPKKPADEGRESPYPWRKDSKVEEVDIAIIPLKFVCLGNVTFILTVNAF